MAARALLRESSRSDNVKLRRVAGFPAPFNVANVDIPRDDASPFADDAF